MNEVEKLYENAGIKKGIIPCPANYYGYDCTRNNQDDKDCSCAIEGYPLFTAEKQLELIKWLGKNKNGFGLFDDGTESFKTDFDANRKLLDSYRSALDTIQRMVLSAWEQGKYLDDGLYNDLTNEFAKINEVLK